MLCPRNARNAPKATGPVAEKGLDTARPAWDILSAQGGRPIEETARGGPGTGSGGEQPKTADRAVAPESRRAPGIYDVLLALVNLPVRLAVGICDAFARHPGLFVTLVAVVFVGVRVERDELAGALKAFLVGSQWGIVTTGVLGLGTVTGWGAFWAMFSLHRRRMREKNERIARLEQERMNGRRPSSSEFEKP